MDKYLLLRMCDGLLTNEDKVFVLYESIYKISDTSNFMLSNDMVDFTARDVLSALKEEECFDSVDLPFVLNILSKTEWGVNLSDSRLIVNNPKPWLCSNHILGEIRRNIKSVNK